MSRSRVPRKVSGAKHKRARAKVARPVHAPATGMTIDLTDALPVLEEGKPRRPDAGPEGEVIIRR